MPVGPTPPVVPAPSLTSMIGAFGEASEFTRPGLPTTGKDVMPMRTPSGTKPTGSRPPSGPYLPACWPGTGCSRPSLASGSTNTSLAMAHGSLPVSANRLALPVV
ncbi:Uncharacterised protein [Mycobacteroides abscessus subsp. bolletii]|nr:Uncharacterised protein [Mycobacteroides abscessus subsp. bolletii]SKH49532.1 Uncharacterised protein [Mycobacteroides abscessus subsp. bolletii]SKP36602.1 Uncharacterised protein [Mycobacteroides abscessus subsp. bolletii]SKT80354.1 Uncharacterised protein [Mycobacteroides abscessus subsp. bolletii]SKW62606.1 Uncharacterised protein [Mycobacteroides abscessus subsp. bolletii]